jgi:molybdopterin converting factor small subunit
MDRSCTAVSAVNVRLKLFASYRQHLPPSSQGSACDLEIPTGTRAVDLLARFSVPTDDGASVILINGRSVEPERVLEEGDVIAAFPAMAGG